MKRGAMTTVGFLLLGCSSGSTPSSPAGTGMGACVQTLKGDATMIVGCEEYLAGNESILAKAMSTCNGAQSAFIDNHWAASCPAGEVLGCKYGPGKNGTPGGEIIWNYKAGAQCNADAMSINADGTPAGGTGGTGGSADDAGTGGGTGDGGTGGSGAGGSDAGGSDAGGSGGSSGVAWDGKFGPGGPVSLGCFSALSGFLPGVQPLWTACAVGNADPVCAACITTDYAAPSCPTNANFTALFNFACHDATISSAGFCGKECGH